MKYTTILAVLLGVLVTGTPSFAGKKEEALAKIQAFLDEGDLRNAKGLIDYLLKKVPGDPDLLRLLEEWRVRKGELGPLLTAKGIEKPENRAKLRALAFRVVTATARGNPDEWAALLHVGDDAKAKEVLLPHSRTGSAEDVRVARDLLARIGKPAPEPAPDRPVAELLAAVKAGPEKAIPAFLEAERRALKALRTAAKTSFGSTKNHEVRCAAAGLLLALGEKDPRTVLRKSLRSARAVEAVAAMPVLLRHPGKGKAPLAALLTGIEADEAIGRVKPTLLEMGFTALAAAKEKGAREFLEARLAKADLRVDAARALGVLGDPKAVPALLAYLRTPPPGEESAAAGGLGFLGRGEGMNDAAAADEVQPLLVGALALLRVTVPGN